MDRTLHFWVMGGDLRQAKLAQLLAEDGHQVHTFALEEAFPSPGAVLTEETALELACTADCVVLPLPAAAGGLLNCPLSRVRLSISALLDALAPGQVICGGRLDPVTLALAGERGLTLHDYFAREELAVANAVPTAEGAIQLAMEQLPITLHGARVLVVGFGRVGKLVSHRMRALGARVCVAARRCESLAWAQALDYDALPLGQLTGRLAGYDLVVNTVPTQLLGEAELAQLKPRCLVLDLASKPGGVDLAAAARLGRKVVWALSLPGQVAPVTAGAAIQHTIYNILHELGKFSPGKEDPLD